MRGAFASLFCIALLLVPLCAGAQPAPPEMVPTIQQLPSFLASLSADERRRVDCFETVLLQGDGSADECVNPFVRECTGTAIATEQGPELLACYRTEWVVWSSLREKINTHLPSDWRESLINKSTTPAEASFVIGVIDDEEWLMELSKLCRKSQPTLSNYEDCAFETALSAVYRLGVILSLQETVQ